MIWCSNTVCFHMWYTCTNYTHSFAHSHGVRKQKFNYTSKYCNAKRFIIHISCSWFTWFDCRDRGRGHRRAVVPAIVVVVFLLYCWCFIVVFWKILWNKIKLTILNCVSAMIGTQTFKVVRIFPVTSQSNDTHARADKTKLVHNLWSWILEKCIRKHKIKHLPHPYYHYRRNILSYYADWCGNWLCDIDKYHRKSGFSLFFLSYLDEFGV